jgi:replicative superfamily II helicase
MPLELSIKEHGLRDSFINALRSNGIEELYEWQAAAVEEAGPNGANFVYTAPTSGGKSLVADILMCKRIQKCVKDWRKPSCKVLVLVPYLSIGVHRPT